MALAAVAALAIAAGCGTADDDPTPPEDSPTAESPEEDAAATETGEGTGAPTTSDDGETDEAGNPPQTDDGAGAGSDDGDGQDGSGTDGQAGGGGGQPSDDGSDGDGGEGQQPEENLEGFVDPGTHEESEPGGYDLVVTDIRTGVHNHFERVVLDIEGGSQVGWSAEYTDNPALDGSGAPVSLAGDGTLAVIVRGVALPSGDDHPYDPGQLLVQPDNTSMVTEVLRTAPFEGQLQVFVGTREEVAFRVFRLGDPERLVIDVMTH
ncbi:AMIN-like domain-containing (lipo)protein [Ornithinicoccus halotolerans]|uniref:AMIN-like domain-containing (lipo)protein n=1 Tax=Ornithinicoccus halotolerans TaxID=1748220 RepID=UPI00188622C8|nr:AMIN domain-containing protein [Ornithinicoccus halotolerans]